MASKQSFDSSNPTVRDRLAAAGAVRGLLTVVPEAAEFFFVVFTGSADGTVVLFSVSAVGTIFFFGCTSSGGGDGPWPPDVVGAPSQGGVAFFFSSSVLSPSSSNVETSFCLSSVTVHGVCLKLHFSLQMPSSW